MLAMEEGRGISAPATALPPNGFSSGGAAGVCSGLRRGHSYQRREKNNMRRAHKKAVGELTIDTTFAKVNHQPVRQCSSRPSISSPASKHGASVVTQWILLGARDDLENVDQLRHMGVTHVLSICGELERSTVRAPTGFRSCVVVVNDCSDANIESHFTRAFDFIDRTFKARGKVLVQCRKGISRSATLVIAYLMHRYHWPFEQSFNYVKNKRSVINPNLGFVLALENFAKQRNFGVSSSSTPPSSPVDTPPSSCIDEESDREVEEGTSDSHCPSASTPQCPMPSTSASPPVTAGSSLSPCFAGNLGLADAATPALPPSPSPEASTPQLDNCFGHS